MPIAEKLNQYKNKNIHIVGIGGAEGSAIAEFLVANKISSITGHDFSSKSDFRKSFFNTHLSLKIKERENALNHLLNLPIKINFKNHYLEGIEEADIVFVSQVWFKYSQNMPVLEKIKDDGVLFKTITNLYFELASCRIISITGTNGKTTTSKLLDSIFQIYEKENRKSKVYFAGNDRQNIQVLDKLQEIKKRDVLILETSSTQLLLNSKISPCLGVITNITPNHLDDHGSFQNYIEAKKDLIRYQKKGDFAILNYDNQETRKISEEFKNRAFLFSRKEILRKGCFLENGKVIIKKSYKKNILFSVADIKILGKHNLENILAAVSCAFLFGVKAEIIKKGILKYTGTKHRLKLLYIIKGVGYYDDTQATTPEAAISGLKSFDDDLILIAGGDNKGMKYKELAEKINKKVKLLILFPGDASDEIEKFIKKDKIDFIRVENFKGAVKVLKKYYKKTDLLKNKTVLISPGAAHFYSKFVESSGKSLKEWIRLIEDIK